MCTGSSPLARGLLYSRRAQAYAPGIIPARAGFTGPGSRPREPVSDHPRSRGVYALLDMGAYTGNGSSPLARGLRRDDGPTVKHIGIIPARAGFTLPHRHDHRPSQDHPRSRGVYPLRGLGAPLTDGSSPLARGLPLRQRRLRPQRRIIPARAGFTGFQAVREAYTADHPRSRGVY